VDQWLTKKDRFPALVEQREEAQTEREREEERELRILHLRYILDIFQEPKVVAPCPLRLIPCLIMGKSSNLML
jgi:hypothetical protein